MEPWIQIARDLSLKNIRDFHLIGARSNKLEVGRGIAGWGSIAVFNWWVPFSLIVINVLATSLKYTKYGRVPCQALQYM